MQKKFYLPFVTIFFLAFILYPSKEVLACFSITDDLNFPNPTLNANFNLQPDVNPFTDCWNGTVRIRTNEKNWRLVASRQGPNPAIIDGDPSNNVMASDIKINLTLMAFGMTEPSDAFLVSPFTSQTDLSSIQSGTFIVSGIQKTSGSCSSTTPNYFQLNNNLCLFRDFVFNVGEYNAEISYLLIAP